MKIIVIGAGFGGLSAAAYLAKAGHEVTVLEKNSHPGGRANTVFQDGFQFELGPSWYVMPDVFEEFFADFGHKPGDFYELKRLTPSYRVYDNGGIFEARPRPAASMAFEHIKPGAGLRLARFLDEAKREYEFARRKILPLDGLSKREFLKAAGTRFLLKPSALISYHERAKQVVADERLQRVLEFMTMFLGGSPHNIPALYSMLAHADFGLGVWYPKGGFYAVAQAVEQVSKAQGVKIVYDAAVQEIVVRDGRAVAARAVAKTYPADAVVANADYHFVDTQLVPEKYQTYNRKQWQKKTFSPSAVLGVVGVKKRLDLAHHNLFFDTDWDDNIADLFDYHRVNKQPLFYVNTPSKSDSGVAPKEHENLVVIIPVSSKAKMSQQKAEQLVQDALKRVEARAGEFAAHIVTKSVLTPDYFEKSFGALGGNAFGLSHTLAQTGPLRPPIRSPRLPNLYFAGQNTTPGTGVPLVLLSGKNVARRIGQDTP